MSFPGFSNSNGWILDRQMFIYMFLNGGSPITENNLESKRFFSMMTWKNLENHHLFDGLRGKS